MCVQVCNVKTMTRQVLTFFSEPRYFSFENRTEFSDLYRLLLQSDRIQLNDQFCS